jgi:hypothetical protein
VKIADLFVDLHLDTGSFDRELRSTLARASSKDIRVGVKADTKTAEKNLQSLTKNVNNASTGINTFSGRTVLMADALLTLAPAISSIGAVAVPTMTALSQAAVVGATAAGTLALAFNGVGDAMKATNKAALDPTTANLQAMRDAMAELSPEARAFVTQITGMHEAFDKLQASAGKGLFPGLIAGIDAASDRFPELNGLVEEYGTILGDIAEKSGKALASDRWNVLFDYLSTTAQPTLTALADSFGNVAHGAFEILNAFAPLSNDGFAWVRDVTADFDTWATSLKGSKDFREFTDYVRQVGPQVAQTIGAITMAFVDIGQAAAPLAGPVLNLLEGIAKAASAIADSPIGPSLVAAAIGMRLMARIGPGVSAALTGLSTAFQDLYTSPNRAATAMERFGGAAKMVAGAAGIGLLATSLSETNEQLGGFEAVAGGALAGFSVGGPIGAGIGAAAGAMGFFALQTKKASDELESLKDFAASGSLFDLAEQLKAAETAEKSNEDRLGWVRNGIKLIPVLGSYLSAFGAEEATTFDNSAKAAADRVTQFKAADESIKSLTRSAAGVSWDKLSGPAQQQALTNTTQQLIDMGFSVEDLANMDPKAMGRIVTELGRAGTAAKQTEAQNKALTQSLAGLDSNMLTTAQSASAFATALESLVMPSLNLGQSQDDLQRSFHAMTTAAQQNGTTLRGNSEAALNNRDALRAQIGQIVKVATSQAEANRSSKTIAGTLQANTNKLFENAKAAGFNASQVKQLAKQYGLTPKLVRTVIEAAGVERATATAKNLKQQYNSLPKKVKTDIATNGVPKTKGELKDLEGRVGPLTKGQKKILLALEAKAAKTGISDIAKLVERLGKKNVKVTIKADGSVALKTISAADKKADALKNKKVNVKLDGDPKKFLAAVKTATSSGKAFAAKTFTAKLDADPKGAISGAAAAKRAIDSVKGKTVTITVNTVKTGEPKATGGLLRGPGTGTSDSIPAMLSDGEYVIRAAAVKKIGVGTLNRMNAMGSYAKGGLAKFAAGGSVSKAAKAAASNRADYLFDKRLQELMDRAADGNTAALDKAIAMLRKARGKVKKWGDAYVQYQQQIDDALGQKAGMKKALRQNKAQYLFDRKMQELSDRAGDGDLKAFDAQIALLRRKMAGVKKWSDAYVELREQIDSIRQAREDAMKALREEAAALAKQRKEAMADFALAVSGDFFHDGIAKSIVPGADFRSIIGGFVDQAKALLDMGAIGSAAYARLVAQAKKYTLALEGVQKALDANAKAQEVANEKLQEAEQRLQAAQQAYDGLKESAKGAITALQGFAESGAANTLEEAQKVYEATLKKYGPNSRNTAEAKRRLDAAQVTPSSIISKLQGNLAKVRAFAGNIRKLINMGLGKAAIQEILNMGPIEGAIYAEALAGALPSQIKDINSIQNEIEQIGESLGINFADKFAGDELRNAQMGKDIAQGIVDGLESEQKRLEQQMTDLGNALANALKKALGIHSPSLVFKDLGVKTMDGLRLGIEKETDGVLRALPVLDDQYNRATTPVIPGRQVSAPVMPSRQVTTPVQRKPDVWASGSGTMVNIEKVEISEQVSLQTLTQRLDFWVRSTGRLR